MNFAGRLLYETRVLSWYSGFRMFLIPILHDGRDAWLMGLLTIAWTLLIFYSTSNVD